MLTRIVVAATNGFPSGRSFSENTCACYEDIQAIDDALENLSLNFFTCAKKNKFRSACAQELRNWNTNCSVLRL